MASHNELTPVFLHGLFDYVDGELFYRVSRGHIKKGAMAGTVRKDGRKQTIINGKHYLNHRLVFLMHHGYLPEFIDHINGNPRDNRLENLREATRVENAWNKKMQHNNTSGIKGVCWHKQSEKWDVRITVGAKRIGLGRFVDIELAELVAVEGRDKYHKEFARNG
jgi:hypothetical protein